MINIDRVLCPVDFSDCSQHALMHAAALARWYEATLTVLHVHRIGVPPAALAPGVGPVPFDVLVLTPVERARLVADLQRFTATTGTSGVTVEFKIAEGPTVTSICDEAAAGRADVMVVGTHGRSGVERLVLGSIAEKLLRKAPCSVLAVPPAAAAPPAPRLFSSIVVATDFSESSDRALQYAFSLAQEADADLTVLHVVDAPQTAGEWVYDSIDMSHLVTAMTEQARARLAEAIPASVRDWCRVRERLEEGRPFRQIVRVAEEQHAGLIVVGVHSSGPVERFFVGSTANQVVRHAPCPVLCVRG
jgi:nucleotide-binding universal stress UspA family protein